MDTIVDSLHDLGLTIDNNELTEETLQNLVANNLVAFSGLISILSQKLSRLLNLEETINKIESPSEEETLCLEISTFLKELSCPYRKLMEGPMNERFHSAENKLDLLQYLITELQAAKIVAVNQPTVKKTANTTQPKLNESEESKALRTILSLFNLSRQCPNNNVKEMIDHIESKTKELISNLPNGLAKSLFNFHLTEKQWEQLASINQGLFEDFLLRRELLMTRLDVTIQSFKWADSMKKNNNEITSLYQKYRKQLPVKPTIKLFHILCARENLLKQEKTCSTRIMTKSHLHKIIIPKPPDRGGRTYEMNEPAAEMPSFMQRKSSANPQGQRQQHRGHFNQGGARGRGGYQKNYGNQQRNDRPKSEFERFQDDNYGNNQRSGAAAGRGGGYRGGGGGRGGANRNHNQNNRW